MWPASVSAPPPGRGIAPVGFPEAAQEEAGSGGHFGPGEHPFGSSLRTR